MKFNGLKRRENMSTLTFVMLTIVAAVISLAPIAFVAWAVVKLLSILQGWSV